MKKIHQSSTFLEKWFLTNRKIIQQKYYDLIRKTKMQRVLFSIVLFPILKSISSQKKRELYQQKGMEKNQNLAIRKTSENQIEKQVVRVESISYVDF